MIGDSLLSSCTDLFRASMSSADGGGRATTFRAHDPAGVRDLDGRDKPGHDARVRPEPVISAFEAGH